jgi:hypothetical protein
MIALLAGSVTSPERKFPAYTPDKSPEEAAALKKAERQAITSLLNALLSIVGSGFAAWWAAGKTGWKNEWVCNVKFSLCDIEESTASPVLLVRCSCGSNLRSGLVSHLGLTALTQQLETPS